MRTPTLSLGMLVLLVIAGAFGRQAGPRPQAAVLDECPLPTFANRDWCLTMQFPNVGR